MEGVVMVTTPQIQISPPGEAFVASAVEFIQAAIRTTLEQQQTCSVSLSGGSTPKAVYQSLATRNLPWDRLRLYFGDERCVAPEHELSNYAMVKAALIDPSGMCPDHVFRMPADRADLATAASDYAKILPPSFDLLLLGMGADAHTASIFPDSPVFDHPQERVAIVQGPAPSNLMRMTITPRVIASAKSILVLIAGADKSPALARALGPRNERRCPIQLASAGVWLVDEAAALPRRVAGEA